MKKIVFTMVLTVSFALAEDIPSSYSKCQMCHGLKGEVNTFTQNKSYIPAKLTKAGVEKALLGYKDGTYGGEKSHVMRCQVMKLTDLDIKSLAEYIGK